MAGEAAEAGEDADPGKATSKLLAKAALAAGETAIEVVEEVREVGKERCEGNNRCGV